jgi:hypothetical protein
MPQNPKIDKAVADAKATLSRMDKNFPYLPKETPKEHEYSNTPYKMARTTQPKKSDVDNEIEGTGKSINFRLKQQKAVNQLPELK